MAARDKPVVLWLEDRPKLSEDVLDAVWEQFDLDENDRKRLVKARSLEEARQQIDALRGAETPIGGFIVDLQLPNRGFGDFDAEFEGVGTFGGRDAGYLFFVDGLRNWGEKSPYGADYAKTPVFVLTTTSRQEFRQRYGAFFDEEKKRIESGAWGSSTWLTKPEYEEMDECVGVIGNWLKEILSI